MIRWLLRFAAALAFLLLAAELITRSLLMSPTAWEPDETYGLWRVPGASIVQSTEGYGRFQVDADGFVDAPHEASSRVLLLGDSFTLALHVGYGERYSERTEQLLDDVEVRNAAFAGWFPANYSLLLQNLDVTDYDLVVIQISDSDLFEMDHPGRIRFQEVTPGTYTLEADPFPTRKGPLRNAVNTLSRFSGLAEFIRVRSQMLFWAERRRLEEKLRDGRVRHAQPADESRLPADVAERLRFFHSTLEPWHERLIYLYLPRLNYAERPLRFDWPECRDLIHKFAAESGAIVVDPTAAMLADFESSQVPVAGFHNSRMGSGHLNARGHRLVAEALAERIGELLK